MSYSTRLLESLTIPCLRPQAAAAARPPPVKMRIPLNFGTVSAAFTSSATALTMTDSSATSPLIETNEILRKSGHKKPCLPPCGTHPTGHPMLLLLAGSLLQDVELTGLPEVREAGRGKATLSGLALFPSTSRCHPCYRELLLL